jgi:HSP20 family protein
MTSYPRWTSLFDDEWFEQNDELSVYETDNELVVKAFVAGVPSDKIDVSIESGVITIKASYQETEEEKQKKKVVYKESRMMNYVYTTNIPCPVETNKAKAEVANGILTLSLPKSEEAKPKKISVQIKGK